jgi:hypothetical protein
MRTKAMFAGLVVALWAAGSASAGSWWFTSTGPISYQVVDTGAPTAPIAAPETLTNKTGFNLFQFNPQFRGNTNTRNLPTSNFPTASQLPAADYLKAFRMSLPGR